MRLTVSNIYQYSKMSAILSNDFHCGQAWWRTTPIFDTTIL